MTASPSLWPDLSGRLSGQNHVLAVRVYFEDTDFSGIVYHASYLRWCERGRSDFLRLRGISHSTLAEGEIFGEPCAFVVRRITADFFKPTRIDDVLEVHTSVEGVTKASVIIRQKITRGQTVIFSLSAQCVLVGMDRILRLPEKIVKAFEN